MFSNPSPNPFNSGGVFSRLIDPLSNAWRRIGEAGLASQCAVCRSWPAGQVCDGCVARFMPAKDRCIRCALALAPNTSLGAQRGAQLCASCIKTPPPLDACAVAVSYDWPWSDLVTRYKFGNHPGWAPFFAKLLLDSTLARDALGALARDDFLLAMPLSAQRLEQRGFNQAWELASSLATRARLHCRADAQLLLRVKDTRPQTELKREARLANVKGAFAVDPLRAPSLAGRRVVLVDDVMTSGASLFTAASTLKAAGAIHVTGLAFARTPPA